MITPFRCLIFAFMALAIGLAAPASAMSFRLMAIGKSQKAILATGPINRGDAARFASALDLATRDRHHTKAVLLNSPGGLVTEALIMAEVMDRVHVSTIIPAKAVCASACASVLFVSGRYRRIDKGGYLAIHSCFDSRNGRQMVLCNAIISVHAQHEGASGIAIMALQQVAGPRNAIIFDAKSAACYGLTWTRDHGNRLPPCIKKAALRAHRR